MPYQKRRASQASPSGLKPFGTVVNHRAPKRNNKLELRGVKDVLVEWDPDCPRDAFKKMKLMTSKIPVHRAWLRTQPCKKHSI